jgi:hypothetical protein
MKKLFALFLVAIALNIFASCAQNRQLVEQLPFTITNAYYTSWIAQQPKNTSGIDLSLTIPNKTDDITLKSVYFKGQLAVLREEKETIYSTHFISAKENPDYTISSDIRKEVNNPKPQLYKQPPVELRPDDALLIYLQDGKERYYKLKNLKDKGTKYPAEAPFNKNN